MKLLDVLATILHIILLPVYIVLFFVFLLIWGFFTITLIGPLLQFYFTRRDKKKLNRERFQQQFPNDIQIINVPAGVHGCSKSKSYKIFAIYSVPKTSSTAVNQNPPIVIPNGLGATAVLISQMQEKLVEQGFTVLSFDRLGVGMSDANESNEDPSAIDVCMEMDYVMEAVRPNSEWIILGPSMGSIVGQCYISMFSEKVVGFLNMDGLPYPFFKHRNSFMWAAFIYRIYASIIWTGILRPFIGIALKSSEKMFSCEKFPLTIAIAQMNQSGFYGNVAKEMITMMDCCEMTEAAWGKYSVLRIPEEYLNVSFLFFPFFHGFNVSFLLFFRIQALICAPPNVSIEFDEVTGARTVTEVRSISEVGGKWSDKNEIISTVAFLKGDEVSASNSRSDSKNIEQTETANFNSPLLKYGIISVV
jgi:hypothetical protein